MTNKLSYMKRIFLILILVMIIFLFVNQVLADDNLTDSEIKRGVEINASNIIASVLLVVFIVVLFIYFGSAHAANKKHIDRAKIIAKKARMIINQVEQEELEELEKQKEIQKKAAQRKSYLQKSMQKVHNRSKKLKTEKLFSEFDEEGNAELLKPGTKYADKRLKEKQEIFLNLNNLAKQKKEAKKNIKTKKVKSDLFDKLETISKNK